jgi:hypothetical protein
LHFAFSICIACDLAAPFRSAPTLLAATLIGVLMEKSPDGKGPCASLRGWSHAEPRPLTGVSSQHDNTAVRGRLNRSARMDSFANPGRPCGWRCGLVPGFDVVESMMATAIRAMNAKY